MRNSRTSTKLKNRMPINNPREPPILEIKENSFILGICVIFNVEKSDIENEKIAGELLASADVTTRVSNRTVSHSKGHIFWKSSRFRSDSFNVRDLIELIIVIRSLNDTDQPATNREYKQ